MDPADPGEHDGGGKGCEPLARGRDPPRGSIRVGELVVGGHHVAVDVARPVRLQLAGEDGDHRLVEQGRPLRDAAQPDEGAAFADGAGCDEVGYPVASPQISDGAGRGAHPLKVRAVQRTLHLHEVAQVALLRALGLVAEQAAGSLDPPAPGASSPRSNMLTATPIAAIAAARGRAASRNPW